jgi:hypothetical protein
MALLRLRGCQQFGSRTGCQLFQIAYQHIVCSSVLVPLQRDSQLLTTFQQIQSLQTGRQPPSEASEWFDAIKSSGNLAKVNFVPLYLYCDEAARICGYARSLIDEGSPENMLSAIADIVRACNDFERSMNDYFGGVLTHPSLNSVAQFAAAEGLKSLSGLHIRNYIDSCFLRLHYIILELLFHVMQLPGHSISQSEDIARLRRFSIIQSQARADQILMTLPYLLPKQDPRPTEEPKTCIANWAHGVRLLWPLRLIVSSPVVYERQKTIANLALSRIAYEVGIMQAVGTYYETLTAYEKL